MFARALGSMTDPRVWFGDACLGHLASLVSTHVSRIDRPVDTSGRGGRVPRSSPQGRPEERPASAKIGQTRGRIEKAPLATGCSRPRPDTRQSGVGERRLQAAVITGTIARSRGSVRRCPACAVLSGDGGFPSIGAVGLAFVDLVPMISLGREKPNQEKTPVAPVGRSEALTSDAPILTRRSAGVPPVQVAAVRSPRLDAKGDQT